MLSNYELPTPLDAWKCGTHREWEWRHDSVTNTLYRRHQKNFQTYKPDKSKPYNFNEDEWVETLPSTVPVSVKVLRSGVARINSRCKEIDEEKCSPKMFWEVLDSWGGKWMWELVDPKYRTGDHSWLDRGMKHGTLVCCLDGSYKRKISPFVSGSGLGSLLHKDKKRDGSMFL